MTSAPGRSWRLGLLLAAACVALTFRGALAGGVLFRRDISLVWLPQVESLVRCVASGAWPLWDPWRGFGAPLLADPRAGVFYPPTWSNLVLPPGPAYTVYVVSHLVFSAWGMLRLARAVGMSPLGGALAAAAWVAMGPLPSLASTWHHLAGAAWIPWVFAQAERALDAPGTRATVAWGACLALQAFAGSPDYSVLTLAALVPWAAARRPRRPAFVAFALAVTLAAGLAAAQWIPAAAFARDGDRARLGAERAGVWSMHPALLAETVLPVMFWKVPLSEAAQQGVLEGREPWLHSIHLGGALVALAVFGVAARREPRAVALAVIAVGATVVALGRHLPGFDAIAGALPAVAAFRFPVKAMVLAAFAVALLAGLGLERWREGAAGPRARIAVRVVLAVVVAAAAAGAVAGLAADAIAARTGSRLPWDAASTITRMAGAAVAAAVALALLARRNATPAAAVALAAVSVAAPLAVHLDLHPTAPARLYALRPPAADLLRQDASHRVYVEDYSIRFPRGGARDPSPYRLRAVPAGFTPAAAVVLGVHLYLNPPTAARWGLRGSYDADILGFDPPPRARAIERLREIEDGDGLLRVLRAGGVQHAVALRPAQGLAAAPPLAVLDGLFADPIHVYRVPGALPRAWVVDGVRIADGTDALDLLASAAFDPSREVILADGTAAAPGSVPAGTARVVSERADRLRVEVDVARPGWLVLAEGYARGWRATVDGRAAEVLRANVVLRAVPVDRGAHVVELAYRPPEILPALGISLASVLAAAAWAWRARTPA